jgi:hypothetical protein
MWLQICQGQKIAAYGWQSKRWASNYRISYMIAPKWMPNPEKKVTSLGSLLVVYSLNIQYSKE